MAVRPPLPVPALSRRAKIVLIVGAALIALVVALGMMANVLVDYWWYVETKYTEVFWTMWRTRVLMFTVFGVVAAGVIAANMVLAYKLRPSFRPMSAEQQNLERYRTAVEPRRRLLIILAAIVILVLAGMSAQAHWQDWLLWRNSTPFGIKDPQFGLDVSFYTFELPMYRFVLTFLFAIVALALVATAVVHYLYGGIRLNSPGQRFTNAARSHLTVLLGVFVLLKAAGYWFDRYDLNFSSDGVVAGASNSDVNALLPAKTILVYVAIICAIAFFANVWFKNFALPAMSLALLILASLVIGTGYPAVYEQFVVKPNQASKEAAYIQRNITATQSAYGVGSNNVTIQQYAAQSTASPTTILDNTTTIPNARLLDPNVISSVVTQTQQVRNVYAFQQSLDIDRYAVDGKTQDYVVGVRELDLNNLSSAQNNWINAHTVYTHGYGFIAAPANQVTSAGLPVFVNDGFDPGAIPVTQPRIYYGELDNDYSIVGKTSGPDKEFDRPAASDSTQEVNNTYNGAGGVSVGNFFRKTVFAIYYRERNFILNSSIGKDSKVMYIRDPRQRVEKAAPFLQVDGDPYPAVVNGRVVWIVDGYTTSSQYPYSQETPLGDVTTDSTTNNGTAALPNENVNYIRNSVKATVDAYDGTVTLYQTDTNDPVLKTWMKAYPGLVKPKASIPPALASHFRYPEDLFKVQRDILSKYHVNDSSDFYQANNFWKVPVDPTSSVSDVDQPPYYVLSQTPGEPGATFNLTSALSPLKKENLAAYMSVDSDPAGYGKITVLQMPQSSNIYGPSQVQSAFKSDPTISTQLSLLDRGGSKVIYGNLLTLPVAGGLLYVEPLYVEGSSSSSYPTLQKVLLNFGTKIEYADTLTDGLNMLFGPGAATGSSTGGGTVSGGTPSSSSSAATGSSSASGGGSNAAAISQANADLQKGLNDLATATKAGDYAGIGTAQQEIAAAGAELNAALGTASPTTTAAASTTSSGP